MKLEKSRRLRALLRGPGPAIGVGAQNALEAKLIARAGFDFVWSSSFGVSASYAVPDASLLSMTQYLEAARAMNDVMDLPILVDADTGYGNANNVMHATRLFEDAGIAGLCFEDKTFPKENSLLAGGRQVLAEVDEFCGKLCAATDTRRDPDFVVVARTEALIAGWGQDEAYARARRYVEAGADAILIHSKSKTPDEILEFVRRWDAPAPLVLVPTNYPSLSEKEIAALGKVKLVIYANQPMRAAVKATEELLAEIRKAGGVHTVDDRMAPLTRIFELQDLPDVGKPACRPPR